MKPSQVGSVITEVVQTGRNLFLWGPPGVGKSDLVRQAVEDRYGSLDGHLIDVRAVLLDPVDIRGLPHVEDGITCWAIPEFLPQRGEGILFLDELPQAPPLVQAACLQLTLDRRVGEYQMPDGWAIIAAGNREGDLAGANRLNSALANRFTHLNVEADHKDWVKWAARRKNASGDPHPIRPEILSLLSWRPELLYEFNPKAKDAMARKAYPTPRSWEVASDLLEVLSRGNRHSVLAGTIGAGAASELMSHIAVHEKLPDLDEIVSDPDGFNYSDANADGQIGYALATALSDRCKGADGSTVSAVLKALRHLKPEFLMLGMIGVTAANFREAARVPETEQILEENPRLERMLIEGYA